MPPPDSTTTTTPSLLLLPAGTVLLILLPLLILLIRFPVPPAVVLITLTPPMLTLLLIVPPFLPSATPVLIHFRIHIIKTWRTSYPLGLRRRLTVLLLLVVLVGTITIDPLLPVPSLVLMPLQLFLTTKTRGPSQTPLPVRLISRCTMVLLPAPLLLPLLGGLLLLLLLPALLRLVMLAAGVPVTVLLRSFRTRVTPAITITSTTLLLGVVLVAMARPHMVLTTPVPFLTPSATSTALLLWMILGVALTGIYTSFTTPVPFLTPSTTTTTAILC
jgi:hypothetical protein